MQNVLLLPFLTKSSLIICNNSYGNIADKLIETIVFFFV